MDAYDDEVRRYERLCEHQVVFQRSVDDFCRSVEFVKVGGLGRHPKIRLQRERETIQYIDLWMSLDVNGQQHFEVPPTITYDLWAGASAVVGAAGRGRVMYSKVMTFYVNRPLDQVVSTLLRDLEAAVPLLDVCTVSYLTTYGNGVVVADSE